MMQWRTRMAKLCHTFKICCGRLRKERDDLRDYYLSGPCLDHPADRRPFCTVNTTFFHWQYIAITVNCSILAQPAPWLSFFLGFFFREVLSVLFVCLFYNKGCFVLFASVFSCLLDSCWKGCEKCCGLRFKLAIVWQSTLLLLWLMWCQRSWNVKPYNGSIGGCMHTNLPCTIKTPLCIEIWPCMHLHLCKMVWKLYLNVKGSHIYEI